MNIPPYRAHNRGAHIIIERASERYPGVTPGSHSGKGAQRIARDFTEYST